MEKRRRNYCGSQKDALLVSDRDRAFFKNIQNYKSHERQQKFDVMSLFPGKTEAEVAECLEAHSNAISSEFDPLEPHQIPVTKPRGLPVLEPYQVAGRIQAFRKPKSMVRGDIFPSLFTKFGNLLAIPLCSIFTVSYTHLTLPTILRV